MSPTRSALSRERILAAAVQLADERGLAELTLRKLAADLRVHVTSIYNHVPTFDAVLDGMVEHILVEAKLPSDAMPWREWVRRFIDAMGAAGRLHTGAFGVLLQRPVQGADASAAFEAGLSAFDAAGLGPADAYSAVRAVALAAVGFGAEQAARAAGQATRTGDDDLPAEAFSHLRAAAPLVHGSGDGSFLSDTLVAGLAAQIRKARR